MESPREHGLLIDRYMGDAYPEVLQTIAVELCVQLSAHALLKALTEEDVARIAFKATEALRSTHGGMSIYIGKGVCYESSLRDREVYELFNGSNYDDLARRYKLTPMRIRQIIQVCREEDRRRRQGNLFGA